MQQVLDGYARSATPDLIATYDSLSSETIYAPVADLFPRAPMRIADIGAGTGRDAAWLARNGHHATAVEPVRELREAGRALHADQQIRWVDDRLPHLAGLAHHPVFDLILLCGVWQHIPADDQPAAIAALARIAAPDALLILSLRHGPGAASRPVFPADPDAVIRMAGKVGFQRVRRVEADSVQQGNRDNGVYWTWLALRKAG